MNEAYHIVFERHGGVGDVLFTTPVLRYYRTHPILQANGLPIRLTFATQKRNTFLFRWGERLIDHHLELFPLQWRIPHKTIDDAEFVRHCKENREKLPFKPDAIISFFEAIERNDAANHVNAYDWHLEWAGIDPKKLSPEEKRPAYTVKPQEAAAARKILSRCKGGGEFRIGVQMHASSLPRTWDKNDKLIRALCRRYPSVSIYSLGDPVAQILEPAAHERLPNYLPLCGVTRDDRRLWAALIGEMDLFVTVDSGAMHIAGALGVPMVGLFSTVPGWTRMKYYRDAVAIDSRYPCAPCFRIGLECGRSIPTPGVDWIPSLNIRGKNETYPCLSSIQVDEVMAVAEKLIEERGLWERKRRTLSLV